MENIVDKTRVLIVEDQAMVRLGLGLAFEKAETIDLIGEAEEGMEGVRKAQQLLPDVVLMDIGLPDIDGIEATRRIKETNPEIRVLMFTSRDSEADVLDSLSSGADGYLTKGSTTQQTITAIQAVKEGTGWLDAQIARIVLSNIQKSNKQQQNNSVSGEINYQDGKNVYGLTTTEMDVLALIVEGLTNPQIADKRFITKATAKAHVHNILQKMCVATRAQATKKALVEGLI